MKLRIESISKGGDLDKPEYSTKVATEIGKLQLHRVTNKCEHCNEITVSHLVTEVLE